MRNRRLFIAILALLGLSLACSLSTNLPVETVQGSGDVVTESREVSGFTAVTLQGVGELIINQNGSESLTITADDNILPLIETRVRGGELIISIEDQTVFNNLSELTYHVTVENIETLELSGAGDVQVTGLEGEEWEVNLSGGGNIEVSGEVDTQRIQINGAGAYHAEDLESRETTVEHNGAGMAVVRVSELLDVTINGLGSVEYIGDPTVREDINGLGEVHPQ